MYDCCVSLVVTGARPGGQLGAGEDENPKSRLGERRATGRRREGGVEARCEGCHDRARAAGAGAGERKKEEPCLVCLALVCVS